MTPEILSRTVQDTPANESVIRGIDYAYSPDDYVLHVTRKDFVQYLNHSYKQGIDVGQEKAFRTALRLIREAPDKQAAHDEVFKLWSGDDE